ncbi:MAG TPA: AraC family transcriptional regulator [Puia sp.]|nr:AraC family transcriptional regulator [Puia sp.]
MEVLEKGHYSGNIIYSVHSGSMIATLTSYRSDNYNGYLHYHDNTHFSFALDGGCVEKKHNAYEITPGTITYYSAGEHHQVLKVAKPTRRINLELEPTFFDEFNIPEPIFRSVAQKDPDARLLMVKIYKEMLTGDEFSAASITSLVLQLIRDAGNRRHESTWPAWVRTTDDYLHDNLAEPISLQQIAMAAHIHPVSISRHFPKYFGCTLGEYMRKIRVEKALSMMRSSGYSLTEISCQCGFFDQSHFIRTFRQLTGFLPRFYQKS